jgi:hypothetical protein
MEFETLDVQLQRAMTLYKAERHDEAFDLYVRAVNYHPNSAAAHTNLGFMYVKRDELARARTCYETALRLNPEFAEARRGLTLVLTQLGQLEALERLRSSDSLPRSVVTMPFRGAGTPVALLLLVTLKAGNLSTERLFDDHIFEVTKLAVELHDPQDPLPAHDVVFNAIGDVDAAGAALDLAQQLIMRTHAPVFNRPDAVHQSDRVSNAQRLGAIPGVIAPLTLRYSRRVLSDSGAARVLRDSGFRFPLLLRSPGYHTGQHFVRVDTPDELADAVATLPGDELLAIQFIDTRDKNGRFRKYRAMFVGSSIYPLHLAVSRHWNVHYLTAGMSESDEHRALDAAFLTDMPSVLGSRVMATLEAIRTTLGLDYAGVDFAIDDVDNVILFEANATMVILPPGPDERFAYRREPVERVFQAVSTMLTR